MEELGYFLSTWQIYGGSKFPYFCGFFRKMNLLGVWRFGSFETGVCEKEISLFYGCTEYASWQFRGIQLLSVH